MAKRATTFALALPAQNPSTRLYQWLYISLRAEILEGRLQPGARLPATRDLAIQYGVSRGTVVNAFEQLKAEGYLEGSVGSGTYVSTVLPEELLHVRREVSLQAIAQRKRQRRLSAYGRIVKPFPVFEVRRLRAFRANLPALDLFPVALWARVAARRLRGLSANDLFGAPAMGFRPLREAIAGYLNTSRGVHCVPEQVAIVSGVQEALDLVSRLFLDPGDSVCMEDPGYIGATLVFEAAGARIRNARLDDQGIEVCEASFGGSRLVYVTPGHQFPLGITMSLPRRLQLLEWARKAGALVFEDDYDSEYRYSGRPAPTLQGLDRHGVVLFAGSFSKVLLPALRLGYLIVPPDLVSCVEAAKSVASRPPLLEQAVLCDFITEGHFGRHLRRMRGIYAERLAVLLESAREKLAGLLEISNVEAGLQTVGWLVGGIAEEPAVKAAAARNVEVIALGRYTRGPVTRKGLQLGFAALDAKEIRRGVRDLAIALDHLSAR